MTDKTSKTSKDSLELTKKLFGLHQERRSSRIADTFATLSSIMENGAYSPNKSNRLNMKSEIPLPQLNTTQATEMTTTLPKNQSATPANRPAKVQLRRDSHLNNVVRNAREEAKMVDEIKIPIKNVREVSGLRGVSNPRNQQMAATMRMAYVG